MRSNQKLFAIGAIAVSILVAFVTVSGALVIRHNQQKEQERVAEIERKKAEEEARLEKLRAEIPGFVKEVEAALAGVAKLKSLDDAKRKKSELEALRQKLYRFGDLKPAPKDVSAQHAKLAAGIVVLQNLEETFNAVEAAVKATKSGDDGVKSSDWINADDEYLKAIGLWRTHPELMAAIRVSGKDGEVGPIDAEREIAEVEKKRRKIAFQVKRERAKIEAEKRKREEAAAKAEALRALCGDKPLCGGWDGDCVGLESALKTKANDPDSVDVENCTDPVLTEACWVTTCDVRGKNVFGVSVYNRMRFSISKLGIEWEPIR